MNRKIIAALLGAALFAAAFTGCGGTESSVGAAAGSSAAALPAADTAAGADLLAQVRAKGELVIATEGTWSPWTYHDENDQLTGFDIEVAQAVAEKLGVRATFVEGEWDGLLAGVEAGRYDTLANGVEITEERSAKYNFTEPYGYIRTAVIVNEDNTDIRTLEDLDGKTTANTLSSTYAEIAESYGAAATGVDDLNQTIELLLAKRIDATLNAEVTYYDYLNAHPDAPLKIAALTEEASLIAFPIPKVEGAEALITAINGAIDDLRTEGVLRELSIKYFGSDITAE